MICCQFFYGRRMKIVPILLLEDFFEGNTDEGSIGCNLLEHRGIKTILGLFLLKVRVNHYETS